MLNLITDDVRRNPFPLYQQLRQAGPVFREPRSGYWFVLDYEGAKRALTDHESFSSAASPPGAPTSEWMIFADPPRHTKLRALITRAFTPRAVANLESRIRELSRELLDRSVTRGEMDLVADYAVPLPLSVIAEMLGAPVEDRRRFRQWSDAMFGLAHTVSGDARAAKAIEEFRTAAAEMKEYVARLLDERRAAPKDDLLTRLQQAEVDGERLSEVEILAFFQLLLLAGHETTTNLIDNAVLCLIHHPDQLSRLRASPELIPSAIEEVLRFRSPVQMMFRITKRDVQMHGQTIPAGKMVLPVIGSANRDPQQFEAADQFDVGRNPNPHIAFGHGIHFCVGAPLARLEGRIALADLLDRFRRIELASDEPWAPREAFHVHGPTSLPIRFDLAGGSATTAA